MKKAIRIAALLTVICICFSMSGCIALDKMRASRATSGEGDSIILQDGTVYELLPECEDLSPYMGETESLYIVEEDVPLLLISTMGRIATKSEDGRFVSTYLGEGKGYYCRSDIYFSVFQRIYSEFTPDLYCYSYWDAESFTDKLYTLTPEQVAALELVCSTQEPQKLPATVRLEYDRRIDLVSYSSDYLFCRDAVDICVKDGEYYMVTYDYTLYNVPEDMKLIFEEIAERKNTDKLI